MLKKTVIILSVLMSLLVIFLKFSFFYKEYLTLFKKNGVIAHFNNGKLDGDNIIITDGKVEKSAQFVNGLKEGWTIVYYPDGKIKNKTFYKNNKADGPEYDYYESGNLKYSANYKNDKLFGDVNWYSENGKLESYAVFDIRGKSFCLLEFDQRGKLLTVKGPIFSPYIYSINEGADSTEILDFSKKHFFIKDLYIAVAKPPNLKLALKVVVNDTSMFDDTAKSNVVKISNAFRNKGIYKISISGRLMDKKNNIINGANVNEEIIKN